MDMRQMMVHIGRHIGGVAFAALLITGLLGCGTPANSGSQSTTPTVSAPAPTVAPASTPTTEPELTAEEDATNNPPPANTATTVATEPPSADATVTVVVEVPITPTILLEPTAAPAYEQPTMTSDDELTADEDLANNPPPPQNVRVVRVEANAVHLAWDLPPEVTIPHAYSDRVVEYRIFRRATGELDLIPLATTPDLQFTDQNVQSGLTYEYAVNSIREQNVEGSLSDPPVVATVP